MCCPFFALKDLVDKCLPVEHREIFRFLTRTDEARGNAQFVLDRHSHTAFSTAIEFGQDDAGEPDGLMKFTSLNERIRAGGGIDNEKLLVRSFGVVLREDAVHLRKVPA